MVAGRQRADQGVHTCHKSLQGSSSQVIVQRPTYVKGRQLLTLHRRDRSIKRMRWSLPPGERCSRATTDRQG